MRKVILIIAFSSFIAGHAQTYLPGGGINYLQQNAFGHYTLLNDSNSLGKKWSVTGYGGIGAGIGFFNGGSTHFFPAQFGLQLNRRLTNNLYAFAGVSAAPVYFNFNRPISNSELHRNYMAVPGFNNNGLGIYSGVQAGLMYVNDEKTFSISGSIGVGRSNYPFYPATSIHTQKQTSPLTGTRQ